MLSFKVCFCVDLCLFLIVFSHICATLADDSSRAAVHEYESAVGSSTIVKGKENFPSFDATACIIKTGSGEDDVINLTPLARTDGFPRYNATFNVSIQEHESTWTYTFNPCLPYSLPYDNPHDKSVFGDGCHSVAMCKFSYQNSRNYYFTLGIHSDDKIDIEAVKQGNETSKVLMVFTGIKSQRAFKSKIHLVCDHERKGEEDGLYNILLDNGRHLMFAELHHECCCVGGCWKKGLGQLDGLGNNSKAGADGELMLVIVGTILSLVLMVALIGGLCYVKRTHLQFYSKLPGISPMTPVTNSNTGAGPSGALGVSLLGNVPNGTKNSDFRDYEPAAVASSRRKLLPILNDSMIELESVEMGQRLGGGIFGDTHLAKWKEMTVTVKRLTLSIHNNQLTSDTMEFMKEEVWFLSRQRHRNIVCVLGLCLDGRLPFLLTEYVIGECLKDFLKVNGKLLTWPQRLRMCNQVADGMAFLHSTKKPIIHRDLRCGNLFLSDNDNVKVADFGLTKLLQPMREQCINDECSCQRELSACPATVRWTAPELLAHPRAKEGESSTISTACDVYSFGLVMWEMILCKDPFDEIATEIEVIEIVKNGGRPETSPSTDMMPQFKDLMKTCWDQRPSFRPPFKQVAHRLKELISPARAYQKQMTSNKSRLHKSQNHMNPV